MDNNNVLRRLRYVFDFTDSKMMEIFALSGLELERAEVCAFLKAEEDKGFKPCGDKQLAHFLDGLIVNRRGERDGPSPKVENSLNNNIIFRKLKIALDLKAEDVIEIIDMAGFEISKHELSAFFRKSDNRHYRECQDQILRKFLQGIQIKYRENPDRL